MPLVPPPLPPPMYTQGNSILKVDFFLRHGIENNHALYHDIGRGNIYYTYTTALYKCKKLSLVPRPSARAIVTRDL